MFEPNAAVNEVQDLTSALLDEQATDEQIHRLEELLMASDEARRTYVTWVQLHADLHYMLGNKHLPVPAMTEPTETKPKGHRAKTKASKKSSPLPQVDLPHNSTDTPLSNGLSHQ
jgi:hypothetical protein